MYDTRYPLAFPFLYTWRKNSDSLPSPVWLRDQAANFELVNAIAELGIARPASAIINMPPAEVVRPRRLLEPHELFEVDVDHVREQDFLVLTTRPPKEDIPAGNRMWVEPGQTDLERRMFRIVEDYLEVCARSHIRVARFVREALPAGYQDRGEFSLYQSGPHGRYREFNEGWGWRMLPEEDQRRERVPAFAIRIDSICEGGPGCFIAFSMDALSTAAWCWRLRRDLSHLLAQPGFHFYEMTPREMPERPTDHGWADAWAVDRVVGLPPAA